jgi:hypothetical protein
MARDPLEESVRGLPRIMVGFLRLPADDIAALRHLGRFPARALSAD